MAKRLLDIKPDGTEVWFEHDPITKTNTKYYKYPDLEIVTDYCKALRLSSEYSKRGIKKSWWHYSFIPDSIILKLRMEHKLDIYNKDHAAAIGRIIERDYPYLKVTEGFHKFK